MRKEPSSETTARWRLSGEKPKSVMRWLEIFHEATGFAFWFFELTDLLMWSGLRSGSNGFGEGVGALLDSGVKAASSRSLS